MDVVKQIDMEFCFWMKVGSYASIDFNVRLTNKDCLIHLHGGRSMVEIQTYLKNIWSHFITRVSSNGKQDVGLPTHGY